MGLFNRLFKSQPETTLDVADDELIDVTTVSEPMFAQQLMDHRLPSLIRATK